MAQQLINKIYDCNNPNRLDDLREFLKTDAYKCSFVSVTFYLLYDKDKQIRKYVKKFVINFLDVPITYKLFAHSFPKIRELCHLDMSNNLVETEFTENLNNDELFIVQWWASIIYYFITASLTKRDQGLSSLSSNQDTKLVIKNYDKIIKYFLEIGSKDSNDRRELIERVYGQYYDIYRNKHKSDQNLNKVPYRFQAFRQLISEKKYRYSVPTVAYCLLSDSEVDMRNCALNEILKQLDVPITYELFKHGYTYGKMVTKKNLKNNYIYTDFINRLSPLELYIVDWWHLILHHYTSQILKTSLSTQILMKNIYKIIRQFCRSITTDDIPYLSYDYVVSHMEALYLKKGRSIKCKSIHKSEDISDNSDDTNNNLKRIYALRRAKDDTTKLSPSEITIGKFKKEQSLVEESNKESCILEESFSQTSRIIQPGVIKSQELYDDLQQICVLEESETLYEEQQLQIDLEQIQIQEEYQNPLKINSNKVKVI